MKKLLALILAAFLLAPSVSFGAQRVGGYVTKKGKYVKPHYRSNKNRTQRDNWSSKGRSNPYTGKRGTKKAEVVEIYEKFDANLRGRAIFGLCF